MKTIKASSRLFIKSTALLLALLPITAFAQLSVVANQAATQLANALVGSGVTISNVTLTCPGVGNGTFSVSGSSPLGISSGIIMTTGQAANMPGAASSLADVATGGAGDAQLSSLMGGATTADACVLNFDFVPQGDTVRFRYQFASEEYTGYGCSQYNDAFAFFISGPGISGSKNMALIPGTNTPVTINSTSGVVGNAGQSTLAQCTNTGNNPLGINYINNSAGTSIKFDGFTKLFVASSAVIPCSTYHLKIAIADIFDDRYDSGVFIEGGSLSSTPVVASLSPAPSSWPMTGGVQVTINGTNFKPGSTVTLDGIPVAVTSVTTTAITFTLPAITNAMCSGTVIVNSPSGCGSSSTAFSYTITTPPSIANITPMNAAPGSTIVISGNNFGQSGTVKYGSTNLSIISYNNTSITAVLPSPSAACAGNIVVTNACNAISGSVPYVVSQQPVVTNVIANSPTTAGGYLVTISGTNFIPGATSVNYLGSTISANVSSPTSLSFIAPVVTNCSGAVIVNNGCMASVPFSFGITVPPVINAITPNNAIPGTNVTISGTNFGTTPVVNIGSTTMNVVASTHTNIVVTLPPGVCSLQSITVANSCGFVSSPAPYMVQVPVVTASNDGPVPITGNIELSAAGATTYSWNGPGGFTANGPTATIGFAQLSNAGTYTVTGTTGGCSSTATTLVKVLQGPADVISGIRTWLDASDIDADGNSGNNPANNSAINTWNDKSGNGNDGVQLAGTNAGVIRSDAASVINGKPVVRFAGSNVYNFGNIDIRAGVTPDVSVITVYRLSGQGHEGIWGNDDGNWDRFALASFSFTGNNNNGIASRGPNQNPPYTVIPNSGVPGNLYLFTAIYDGQVSGGVNNGPANGSSFWFNGSLLGTFTDQTEPLNAKTSLRLGFDGDDGFMDGDIAEFIVYDRVLTECEIQDINVYLSNKYGVTYSTAKITPNSTTTFCQGDSVILSASDGSAYQWKLNGNSINGANSQTLVVKQAGSYTVDITGICGKAKSAPVVVTVNALPAVTATNNSPVNMGGTATVSASGATSYTWTGPNGFIAAGQSFNINNAQLTAAGAYIVTGTDANGCKDTGMTTVVVNQPGKALHFDGINDWIGIPVMPAINSIPVTLEAMVKPELRPEGDVFYPNNVLSNDLPGNYGLGFGVNVYNGGSRIVIEYKNGFHEILNAPGIVADQWSHVAVVYNLGNFKVFVNGTEVASINHAAVALNNTVHMHIGKHNDDAGYGTRRFFKGAIDEVRVWNRALCSAEITAQYSCQLNGQGNGLFANYNFDQGFANANNSSVNTLTDATANASTGTLNAFALNGATSNWIAPGGATTNCTPYLVGDIHVKGNGQNIFNNTTTVSAAANTDMGSTGLGNTITKAFAIENNGTAPITVNGISFTGAQAGNFSVNGISFPITIPAAGSANYNIVFNGSSVTQHNATVNIASNDCDEATYAFAIRGTINCSMPAFTQCPQPISADNAPGQCKTGIAYNALVATTGTPAPALTYSMTGATTASGSGNGSGTQFNVGVTNVTITATNSCGSATCNFTVTIKDVTAPVFAGVPSNTTASCESVPTPAIVTASDNCNGATAVNYFQFPNVAANQTHYWPADGNTSDVVGGANGTASGIQYAPGLFGANSFLFNGTATIDAGTAGSISGTGDFSVSAWVKTTSSGGMTIIQQRDASVDGQYILKIGTNHNGATSVPGKAYFLVSGDGGLGEMYSNASVNDGQWHHVAGERNGTALKLYIDGVLDNTTSTPGVVTMNKDGNVRTFIGYDYRNVLFNVSANKFVGQMDNVKVFYKSACPTAYQRNRVWTSKDAAGNMAAAEQNVSVIDATAPTLNCPANIVVNNDNNQCGAIVSFAATATDNCDNVPVITYSKNPSTSFPIGITTVNVQAKDGCGNTSNCSFTVTVKDAQLPVVNAPASTTINCHASSAPAATGTATANDNCGVLEISHSDVSTQDANINNAAHYNYTITRTWKAIDVNNNANTSIQTITVQDVTKPGITVPVNVTLNCQDDNSTTANGTATGTDNCSPVAITYNDASTQDANVNNAGHYNYVITRTWTATDVTGNSTSADQTITVQDITKPGITVPANVTLNCQDDNSTGANGTATGSDNCSPVAITYSDASTQNANMNNAGHYNYVITRTWTATDVTGNSTSADQTITVQDVTKPGITVPANVTLNCQDDNSTSANGTATGTDNCSPVAITYSDASTQNANGNNAGHYNYVITRTWTATDVTGNSTSADQTITVQDVTKPGITVPANVTLNCQDDNSTTANGTATGTDNCSPVAITYSDASTQNANMNNAGHYNYVITRTWTATDVTGNSTSADQTITVQDVTKPGITVPANVTLNCQDDNSTTANGTATGTDNCSPVAITYSDASTQNANVNNAGHYNYVITRTWTATDVTGNSTSANQVITVQDVTKPSITCPANKTVSCKTSVADNGSATGSDNCSPVAITSSDVSTQNGNPANSGYYNYTITRTWKATDVSGNFTTCDQVITVHALNNAAVAVSPVNTINANHQIHTIYLGYGPQSVSLSSTVQDGVGPRSYSWTPITGSVTPASATTSVSPLVSTTYTVTITDGTGCSITQSMPVQVIDVRCGNKVKICHYPPGNPANTQQQCLPTSAIAAHLAHGCVLGDCPSNKSSGTGDGEEGDNHGVEALAVTEVKVYPNPNTGAFTVELPAGLEKSEVVITDMAGKVIQKQTALEGNKLQFDLGPVARGMYMLHLTNGSQNFRTRISVQ
ncbi:choice-of-anchor L domain-containing protein [Polluticoccus soli]|uniref:choice-of-anchor L domain-containing protein n=1 Tax=Polluticoccus soli TaxID=3034150 RepID=UPI0023E0C313|nr:choice-of-anchor L domain-containing protein [Flavipsychrobacter sp. JY13-12]